MHPPLPVQNSGADGRGWQDVHAVGAQAALWSDVGCASVVKLCEREREKSSSHGEFRSDIVGKVFSHRKVAPSAVQPGDTVVALDLFLALGAFALWVGISYLKVYAGILQAYFFLINDE